MHRIHAGSCDVTQRKLLGVTGLKRDSAVPPRSELKGIKASREERLTLRDYLHQLKAPTADMKEGQDICTGREQFIHNFLSSKKGGDTDPSLEDRVWMEKQSLYQKQDRQRQRRKLQSPGDKALEGTFISSKHQDGRYGSACSVLVKATR